MLNFRLNMVKAGHKEFGGSKVSPIGVIEMPWQGGNFNVLVPYYTISKLGVVPCLFFK